MASSTIRRLRSMSLRLPIPCTTVDSPTAIYGATGSPDSPLTCVATRRACLWDKMDACPLTPGYGKRYVDGPAIARGDVMTAAVGSRPGLRPGILKVRHAVITSLAVITPAAAILFLPIPIAANAGSAMPLSIVVAFAVVLVIVNAVYRFSQRISHAGSFFAFVRDSLGVPAGFVAGWLFLAFYPVFVGSEACWTRS